MDEEKAQRAMEIVSEFISWDNSTGPCPISVNDQYWFKKLCATAEIQATLEAKNTRLEQEKAELVEALEKSKDYLRMVMGSRKGYMGDHYVYTPQLDTDNTDAIYQEINAALARVKEEEMTEPKGFCACDACMRERVADLCHQQWSGWMEYLFSKSIPYKPGEVQNYEGAVIIPKWAVDRWARQMKTPYSELPENEKESDREEADLVLERVKEGKMDKDYINQQTMPPWCETHEGPRGGKGSETCSVCFDEKPQDPTTRLEQLFTEADTIIEQHPELIEEADHEQFQRTEQLVEGVEIDGLKPDQPCDHPGCLHHVTHPCEGCGRIAGHYPNKLDLPARLRALAEEMREVERLLWKESYVLENESTLLKSGIIIEDADKFDALAAELEKEK